jgi:hypothetical protein
MPTSPEQLIEQIHAAPLRLVLAVAGGGSGAIAALLKQPGASRTVLEVIVPYCEGAMAEFLGGPPDQACSVDTAGQMAMAAWLRARRCGGEDATLAGIACTTSLATDRPKRGPHRCHLAVQTASQTATWSLQLEKGRRSRAEEEEVVARLLLNVIAETCGLDGRLGLELARSETVQQVRVEAPPAWQDLLLGRREAVAHGGSEAPGPPKIVFSGAFHPWHRGHGRMVEVARQLLEAEVDLEITIVNADKPPLAYDQLHSRLDQFGPEQRIWLTRATTFTEKAEVFPGATFLVGTDTLERIADPRYYGHSTAARETALQRIADQGCRFLVFGRDLGSGFRGLADLDLPDVLRGLCREVPGDQFREDVSSSEIRRSNAPD